jgi:hypothetical protein
MKPYPAWIWAPLRQKHGTREVGFATWHEDECGVCGSIELVTEPKDFLGLKGKWKLAHEERTQHMPWGR